MNLDEFITSLNLADDTAKKKAKADLANYIKTNYIDKNKFDEVNTAKSNLETQIANRDKQLKDLKATTGNKEEFEAKIKELQEANKTAKAQYEANLKNLRIDSAIKLKIAGIAQDSDIVAGLIDKTKLIVSDDGTVTGLDEQLNPLKTSKPFLFKDDKANPPKYVPNGGGKNDINPFKKGEHFNMTKAGELLRENPEQAKILAAEAGFNLGGIN